MRTRMRLFTLCGLHPWTALWPSWAPFQRHAALAVYTVLQLIILAVVALLAACSASPLAASVPATFVPLHHNIPATFVGQESGQIYWLCATQPRRYVRVDGTVLVEEDHYLQSTPCPVVPVQ